MANVKITDLPSGTTLVGTELFESVQSASSVKLTSDQVKTFANSEYIVSSNTNQTTQIIINTLGDVYTKDLAPIYVQNIVDVTRSPGQTEKYKLIVEI